MRFGLGTILVLVGFLTLPISVGAQQITSGFGAYRTLQTRHFRIHYPEDQRAYALHVGRLAEKIHSRLEPKYKSGASRTEVTLVFETDTINAFATSQGFDQIVLFLDNPRLGEFSRYDSWVETLFVHEYTHILSLRDNEKRGNDVLFWLFGIPPNAISPFGLVEGAAVWQESVDGKGRLKDPLTEMIVRTALLEGRYPSIGEIMNGTRRWPYGRAGYLYGGRLWERLARDFGEEKIYRYWNRQGFPLDPNSRLPYAASLGKLYRLQKKADNEQVYKRKGLLERQGLTPFDRLTFSGDSKRFLTETEDGRLLFFANPQYRTPGLFSLRPQGPADPENKESKAKRQEPRGELRFERRQFSSSGIAVGGGQLLLSEDYFFFSDFGLRHELFDGSSFWNRLSKGRNISYPALSADGSVLAYIERDNHSRYLKIERRRAASSELSESARVLLKTNIDGILQYTTLAPDGKRLAVLMRASDRGYARLFLCDLTQFSCQVALGAKGTITQPRFSGDGKSIYFASDVDGIYNLYRYDLSNRMSYRLTRTLGGFFYPTPSKSKRGLYAIAYFANGYDLVRIPEKDLLSEPVEFFRFLSEETIETDEKEDREGYFPERGEDGTPNGPKNQAPDDGTQGSLPKGWKDSHYHGLWEIKPYFTGLVGTISGSYNAGFFARDPLLRHFVLAGVAASVPDPIAVGAYDYTRYNLGLAVQYVGNYWKRSRNPGCMDEGSPYRFLCDDPYVFQEEAVGYIRYTGPGRYFSEQVLVGYAHKKIRNARRSRVVEYNTRDLNLSGPSLILLAGDTRRFPKSVSPELGWRFYLASDYYTKPESKEFFESSHRERIEYGVAEGGLSLYLPSFWAHHVNYLSGYGYTSYGPDREYQKVRLNRFVRGLAYAKAPSNRAASVFTYEYRFPLGLYSEQVLDTHPGSMLNNLSLSFFADYGASFDRRAFKEDWVLAYGMTIGFDLNVAYLNIPEIRITWARGTGPAGEGQVYVSLSTDLGIGPLNKGHRSSGPDRLVTAPYHRGLPGFAAQPGYFRDPRAGGILE